MVTSAQKTEPHTRAVRSIVIVLIITGVYVLVFAPIYGLVGLGTGALAGLPIICAGWLLGRRVALVAGALAFVLNSMLYNLMGLQGWDVILRVGGGPGMLVALLCPLALFKLLAFLISHPGRTFNRDELLQGAWGYAYEGTARTVDNFVSQLRQKLEPDPDAPRYFVTIRGLGYRFTRDGGEP